MYCPKCGNQRSDAAKFCPECGAAVATGRRSSDDSAALPQDETYRQFLNRFPPEEWRDHYRPIFSVLAVARQPLREDHLIQFTGLKAAGLRDALGVVQQFLTEERDEQGRKTYILFHQSLRDHLLDEARSQGFRRAHQDGHALITAYYLSRYRSRWIEALAAALQISDERSRTEMLTALAPHLQGKLLQEALTATSEISDEWYRAKALAGLAPQLKGELLQEALAAASEISDNRSRSKLLDRSGSTLEKRSAGKSIDRSPGHSLADFK